MDNNGYYYDPQYGYDAQPPQKRRGGGLFAAIVIIVVVALLAALIIGLFMPDFNGVTSLGSTSAPAATQPPAAAPDVPAATAAPAVSDEDRNMPELDGVSPILPGIVNNPIPDIFDAVSPGVVGVLNYRSQIINGKEQVEAYGGGSGFVVSSSGYILTNAHVIEDAAIVSVIFSDGEEINAKVIGADSESDVAVLKIDEKVLQPLSLGDSENVRVGEYVLAIGNPLDTDELANTLTFGIISAKAREITIDSYTNSYLQTDAAINFGNSGGPLLDMQGRVIGMNSAKTVTAGYDAYGNPISAEGIGFALPINQVKQIMAILISQGYVERPGIGITVSTVTEIIAESKGLPVGAYVESVVRGGPADQAGVKMGDVIVAVNGVETKTQTELIDIVNQTEIGDPLTLRIYRADRYDEYTLTVANKSSMNFKDTAE